MIIIGSIAIVSMLVLCIWHLVDMLLYIERGEHTYLDN